MDNMLMLMLLQSLRLLPRQLPRRRRRLLVPPPRIQDLERAPDGGYLRASLHLIMSP